MNARKLIGVVVIALIAASFVGWAQEKQVSASDLKIWVTPSDYQKATGKTIPTYNEAPMLDQMVSSGQLPAVKDRLPGEPRR